MLFPYWFHILYAWWQISDNGWLHKIAMGIYKDSLHLFAFGDTLPHNVIALDSYFNEVI
jgi:hypothetical protein